MASWLESHSPKTFEELAIPPRVAETLQHCSTESNPPHMLITGPAGVGKTAAWKLVARQVLGPGWQSTTHVMQARDLSRSAGAMGKFEEFLRPEGKDSADTLASRTSLDSYWGDLTTPNESDKPPAGVETFGKKTEQGTVISRLIIIEDADYLGPRRQPYLRRMMESNSKSSRFIMTARTPSRVIDAIRSRCHRVHIPSTDEEIINNRILSILEDEGISHTPEIVGDICYVSNGNLRKAIFLSEALALSRGLSNRLDLQEMLASMNFSSVQMMVEEALRGRVHHWKWEKEGGRNKKVLKGAMGILDQLMMEHGLEAHDVIEHIHRLLTGGRLLLPESLLANMLEQVAKCDIRLQRTAHGRIQIEELLQGFSDASFLLNPSR